MDQIRLLRGIRSDRSLFREFLAEFIGTLFLLLIGISANIQAAMDSSEAALVSAQFAWGLGFTFAVYLAASVSGGHLNPAISFSALLFRQISLKQFILYVLAQFLGAFCGSGLAFVGHLDDLGQLTSNWTMRNTIGANATAPLFATYPTPHITLLGSISDQLFGTAILAGSIALITDRRHGISQGFVPMLAGLTMTMISMTFGRNGGFAINPARDLGPRLFILCVGYGWEVFTAHNLYFWIPLVVPFFGALIGTVLYKLFVGMHGFSEQLDFVREKYPLAYKAQSVSAMTTGPNQLISFSHHYNNDNSDFTVHATGPQPIPRKQGFTEQ